ncbi:MAG TPA: hypothetical protein VNN73_15120 [Blastocatellia bacterium]|nr:hypothetical protein [Blastocatellia bacterium]
MKRLLSFGTAAIMFVAACEIVLAQGSANVVGSWDITIESPQGTRTSLLVIKQEGDKLVGAMKSPRGERPLKSVELKGNDVTMVMTIPFQGDEMTITYKGKVEKDSMKGEADFGGLASGPWSAVPHKEDAAPGAGTPSPSTGTGSSGGTGAINISGVWDFKVETSAGSGAPVFTFKQEGENLSGNYKGQFGEAPISGTVKGNEIKFTVKVNAQGQDVTITYTGKIESKDSMSGKASLGEFGEGTWTAKKKQ